MFKGQGLFSGEIVRDSLIFWSKLSLKLAKWEEKSHTKLLFSQTISPIFLQKIHNFLLVLAWQEIFYQGILEPELLLKGVQSGLHLSRIDNIS